MVNYGEWMTEFVEQIGKTKEARKYIRMERVTK